MRRRPVRKHLRWPHAFTMEAGPRAPFARNIACASPFSLAPAIAPGILGLGGSYGVLFSVPGACALAGAASILPVGGAR